MIQAAPTPVRSLYDQGARSPTTSDSEFLARTFPGSRGGGTARAQTQRSGSRIQGGKAGKSRNSELNSATEKDVGDRDPISEETDNYGPTMNTNGALGGAPSVSRAHTGLPISQQPSTALANGRFPVSAYSGSPGGTDAFAAANPSLVADSAPPVSSAPVPGSTALPNGNYPVSAYAGAPKTPATPTTAAAQQTESANPLTGDTNSAPAGKTQDLASSPVPTNLPTNELANARPFDPANMNHGRALGFSAKGPTSPGGTDVSPVSRPQFSSPVAGQIYDSYVKNVFSGGSTGQPQGGSFLQRSGGGYGSNGGDDGNY